jgi:GDPmannose 4,6-dehydratase
MKKRALITGINGMDGSHLADLLLSKEYDVFGVERRSSTKNRTNTRHLDSKITFLNGDLADQNSLLRCLRDSDPQEVYNLGAQSFVGESWNTPENTSNITGLGVLRMLEAIREYNKDIRFYQASSSEMYGGTGDRKAHENTLFAPKSPYGVAKLYGHWITKNYRESYGMYTCTGILFNHESERRGHEFVTRKITDGVAKIHLGLVDHIALGNLDARRDWGYAPDYVEAMWMMLQQDKDFFMNNRVGDFVIASGEAHSIRDLLTAAFAEVGITNWEPHVKQDPRFMRPADIDVLTGDASKALDVLQWKPKVRFKEMISRMVKNDIALNKDGGGLYTRNPLTEATN